MLQINSKKLTPILFIGLGAVFAFMGFTKLGFWADGPGPGFFPSIMALVMIAAGIATFFMSMKEETKAKYNREELYVILAGVGIFTGTFIIGFVPTVIVYLLIWLRLFEKSTWKVTLIIIGICMFITVGVFGIWLGIQFPMGLLENILS